jgi:hypothetical protein
MGSSAARHESAGNAGQVLHRRLFAIVLADDQHVEHADLSADDTAHDAPDDTAHHTSDDTADLNAADHPDDPDFRDADR